MIDRRQFLKFLAFIPLVGSRLDLNPNYGVGGIVLNPENALIHCLRRIITPTAKAKKAMDDLGVCIEWSIDGEKWFYAPCDHPFYQPLIGDLEFKTDGMVGGICIDED